MATLGTFVSGQTLTAAELNAIGTWTTYTPTWTNLTVGNATQTFRYSQLNKIGFVQGEITFGTTTSITGLVRVSLPSGWASPNNPVATLAYFLDTGVADFYGWTTRWDDSNLLPLIGNAAGTYLQGSGLSATAPFTWGNGDVMRVGAMMRLS